jgi:hypothetical protein
MPSVTSIVIKGHGGADGFVHLAQARVKRERERERERLARTAPFHWRRV